MSLGVPGTVKARNGAWNLRSAHAHRGAVPAPVRDGRRQRHARLVLRRRGQLRPEDAVASARRMLAEGAAIVDVGGESTRPGSEGVSLDEELRRVVPVLEQLEGAPVSIDTVEGRGRPPRARARRRARQRRHRAPRRPRARRRRRRLGRLPLPDAHAGRAADDAGRPALRRRRLRGRGLPRGAARRSPSLPGSPRSAICLDPGIGFGKTVEQNFELVRRLDVLLALGRPVVIGFSRKSSLGRLLGDPEATTGSICRKRRRGRRRLRARRDDPARARRPRDRRGAGRGERRMRVKRRAARPRGVRASRRARERAARRPDVPLRRRARGRRAARRPRRGRVDYRPIADAVREVSDSRCST